MNKHILTRRRWLQAGGALALSAPMLPQASHASEAWPSKPVRFIVPFTPGQGSDVLARLTSERLAPLWKQNVLVDNKPGANGAIAVAETTRSAADGHTVLVTSNSPIVINPNLYRKLPYAPATDLKPVTLAAWADLAIVVNPQVPARTLPELVALLKANPDKYSFGSPGTGSTSHITMELLMQIAGVKMVHVPYKGSGPAMTDLIAGNIQLMTDALPSARAHIASGRIRALCVTGERAASVMPELPTAPSQGISGLPAGGWYGFFVPAGTPATVVERLDADVRRTIFSEEFQSRMKSLGLSSVPEGTPAAFADFLQRDTAFWERTTRSLGLYQTV